MELVETPRQDEDFEKSFDKSQKKGEKPKAAEMNAILCVPALELKEKSTKEELVAYAKSIAEFHN